MRQEIVKLNNAVDTFGFPLSNHKCSICKNRMNRVMETTKIYGGVTYGFGGYKCFRCGHEEALHESGGVLGDVKE